MDAEGVMLGPDFALVRRSSSGYRCAKAEDIQLVQRLVFGGDARLARLPQVLSRIAASLDAGDIVKAQLLGLEIPIGELRDTQLQRLRHVSTLQKEFNPAQPRDENGRWTRENDGEVGATGAIPGTSVAAGVAAIASAPAQLGALAEEVAPFFGNLIARVSVPTAFLGVLLIPTNRSNASDGSVPGAPDISFHFNDGELTLSVSDPDGHEVKIFDGIHSNDGLYRAPDGQVIGRYFGYGQGFAVDPDALPNLLAKAKVRASDVIDMDAAMATVRSFAEAAARQPKICPGPSPDPGKNESVPAAMYQWQICKLPPNYGVAYNGARFDGCEFPTGTLQECKGPNFDNMMPGSATDEWPWTRWFSFNPKKGIWAILAQMEHHELAAADRLVVWHVADEKMATWLGYYARGRGFVHIRVEHTEAPPYDPSLLRRLARALRIGRPYGAVS